MESHLSSSRAEHLKTVATKSALDTADPQNINLFLCLTKPKW